MVFIKFFILTLIALILITILHTHIIETIIAVVATFFIIYSRVITVIINTMKIIVGQFYILFIKNYTLFSIKNLQYRKNTLFLYTSKSYDHYSLTHVRSGGNARPLTSEKFKFFKIKCYVLLQTHLGL